MRRPVRSSPLVRWTVADRRVRREITECLASVFSLSVSSSVVKISVISLSVSSSVVKISVTS
jgi:hypothetical protein